MCGYSTRHIRRIIKRRCEHDLRLLNQVEMELEPTESADIQTEGISSDSRSETSETSEPVLESLINEENDVNPESSNFEINEPSFSHESIPKATEHSEASLTIDESSNTEETCSEDSGEDDVSSSLNTSHEDISNDENETNENLFQEKDDSPLKRLLRNWANKFRITLVALTALLLILKPMFDVNLPLDARTLMGTLRKTEIIEMSGGIYHHFGLERAVNNIIREKVRNQQPVDSIKLIINVDGLPISKSGTESLWLILCSEMECKNVYPVGVFYGKNKPKDSNEFLQSFVDEAIYLSRNGLKNSAVSIEAFVCDAPAKSFVFNLKGHTGYNCCPYCLIEGKFVRPKQPRNKNKKSKGRVCFPGIGPFKLKTDEGFAKNKYNDSDEISILTKIPEFGCITKVPLDYLHLILLGAMKKEISLWLHGPRTTRLKEKQIVTINKRLLVLRKSIPKEFNRRPRLLQEFKFWKGTEFRTFLLYSGIVSMKNTVPPKIYSNFLLLHAAVTILINSIHIQHKENIEYAHELLQQYVRNFGKIYGEHYISYNIHNLLHICEHVLKYGVLDNFSAFRFENYMMNIKRMIRKGSKPVEQIARRYSEMENAERDSISPPEFILKHSHIAGPVTEDSLPNIVKQFKILKSEKFNLDCNSMRDNCVLLKNGNFFIVKNIVKLKNSKIQIIGNKLLSKESLYSEPDSRDFDIHLTDNSDGQLYSFFIQDVLSKVWKIPSARGSIVIPLAHSC